MDNRNKSDIIYALLDYDGYVCKSFYANKDDKSDLNKAEEILDDLTFSALNKTADYFNVSPTNVMVLPIMSGHCWKKDIYPSYKRQRQRNELLGIYRDRIKQYKKIICIDNLEADEVLVLLHQYLQDKDINHIIFSDDKDLKYYAEHYCKINITEKPVQLELIEMWGKQLEQLIAGDSEDNITGIPKVGMKTAEKILSVNGYNLNSVIKIYKEKNIDIDSCLRDLLLLIPMSSDYLKDKEASKILAESILRDKVNDLLINNAIISQIQFLNEKVKEIYDKKE